MEISLLLFQLQITEGLTEEIHNSSKDYKTAANSIIAFAKIAIIKIMTNRKK